MANLSFFQNLSAAIIFYQNCDYLQHLLLIEFPLLQSSWRPAYKYSDARFSLEEMETIDVRGGETPAHLRAAYPPMLTRRVFTETGVIGDVSLRELRVLGRKRPSIY